MGFFSFFSFISLLSLRYVRSQPDNPASLPMDVKDLRRMLDWVHEFSKGYEKDKVYYAHWYKKFSSELLLEEFDNIEDTFSEFIHNATDLRKLLCKGNVTGVILDDKIKSKLEKLIAIHVSMKDIFDDLTSHIKEWEMSDNQGNLVGARATEAKQLEWFKDHGFDESTLNDVSIKELKDSVGKIAGKGKSLERLVDYYTAATLNGPYPSLGLELPWLFKLSSSKEALDMIKEYLESEKIAPKAVHEELIERLHELGSAESPLCKLMKANVTDGTHYVPFKVMKNAKFSETRVERYIDALVDVCPSLLSKLERLVPIFNRHKGEELREILRIHDFAFDANVFSDEELGNFIKSLISEEGPIKKVCEAVWKYDCYVSVRMIFSEFTASRHSALDAVADKKVASL